MATILLSAKRRVKPKRKKKIECKIIRTTRQKNTCVRTQCKKRGSVAIAYPKHEISHEDR